MDYDKEVTRDIYVGEVLQMLNNLKEHGMKMEKVFLSVIQES